MKSLKTLSLGLVFALALVLGVSAKADAAVTNLRQTYGDSDSIQVEWKGDLAADNYYLELSDNNGASYHASGYLAYGTSDYWNNLSAGTTYLCRVASVNAAKQVIARSAPIQVVTAPSQRTTVAQYGATTNSVTLKWNAVAGANSYKIYRYVGSDNWPLTATVTGTQATIGKLASNQEIRYAVCPCRVSNTGFAAEGTDGYIYAKTAPAQVTGVGLTNVWWNIKSVSLGWSKQNNVDGYQVNVYDNKNKLVATYNSSYYSYSQNNMKRNVFYSYQVRAYVNITTGKAYGAWSSKYYSGLNPECKGKLKKGKKNQVTISWKKTKGATGYTLYASTKQNSGYKKIAKLKKSKTKYTLTKVGKKKLKKNKNYYVYVVANKKVGKKTFTTPGVRIYGFKITSRIIYY